MWGFCPLFEPYWTHFFGVLILDPEVHAYLLDGFWSWLFHHRPPCRLIPSMPLLLFWQQLWRYIQLRRWLQYLLPRNNPHFLIRLDSILINLGAQIKGVNINQAIILRHVSEIPLPFITLHFCSSHFFENILLNNIISLLYAIGCFCSCFNILILERFFLLFVGNKFHDFWVWLKAVVKIWWARFFYYFQTVALFGSYLVTAVAVIARLVFKVV